MTKNDYYHFRVDRSNLPMKRVRDLLRIWRMVGRQYRQAISELKKRIEYSRATGYYSSTLRTDEENLERYLTGLVTLKEEVASILWAAGVPENEPWDNAGGRKLVGVAKMLAGDLHARLS